MEIGPSEALVIAGLVLALVCAVVALLAQVRLLRLPAEWAVPVSILMDEPADNAGEHDLTVVLAGRMTVAVESIRRLMRWGVALLVALALLVGALVFVEHDASEAGKRHNQRLECLTLALAFDGSLRVQFLAKCGLRSP